LFSHVYSTIYDVNGDIINDANAYFYQLVVWEIIHETSGTFDITAGEFGIKNAATYPDPTNHSSSVYDSGYYNTAVGVINSWLDAITGAITWESIGYDTVVDHTLTVYVAEGGTDVSQTLISVVSPTTPEPATMLMFGIGLLTLPVLLRRRKIVAH
ncbi:MAG: PEP-CTERM sorting domain-containing protein, partial [Planctomycetaceae bacterium]|nr:PEP-CTERM sorting domain-containing protein [Planctomycetaceae bacterium]